jgi:hypothetical protein
MSMILLCVYIALYVCRVYVHVRHIVHLFDFSCIVTIMKKQMRTYGMYEEELRQFNEAQTIRRGKKKDGYPPSYFADAFEYTQPRRNSRGCGDVTVINQNTGEVKKVPADEVTRVYQHYRGQAGGRYALRTDRIDLAEESA